jgi:putative transposase
MHHRRSIRLKHYNYQNTGIYFVTICTKYRSHLFGLVKNGQMILNKFGMIARDEWIKTAQLREYVKIDAFVIMPDHMHGILIISRGDDDNLGTNPSCRGMTRHAPTIILAQKNSKNPMLRQFSKPIKNSLSTIVSAYKASVTRKINCLRKTPGGIIWQRNYYERIVRNNDALFIVRKYIINNPK